LKGEFMTAEQYLREFEAALAAHVDRCYRAESEGDVVAKAVRYVMSNGGKRVRPVLCMLSAEAAGGTARSALSAAIAIEMVHTYSLVHDDLPCMDDDDLRRGKPTAHKAFGEAFALLTGDALLTDAFGVLSEADDLAAAVRVELVRELATAAGGAGMVQGQALDLHWTARSGAAKSDLDAIHLRKTGYLLGASAAMGALCAGAGREAVAAFRDFGRLIGLAFQIRDDLIDDLTTTGKTQGKDKSAGKLTYLTQMPRTAAAAEATRLTSEALARVEGCTRAPGALTRYVQGLLERTR
jgi:geranylgeranyl pyrophosphate synthase